MSVEEYRNAGFEGDPETENPAVEIPLNEIFDEISD